MKKSLATSAILALALTGCTSLERVESSAPVLLGDVQSVADYRGEIEEFAPELVSQFNVVASTPIEGIEGTPYQTIGQTEGLEEFFQSYAKVSGTSQEFERNWLACYVDNVDTNIDTCHEELAN